ncbi:MAG TPA: RodZ domain-containing protein [Pseudorhodoplanes sp.]|nr:RodZ domain-containing protein [Pseudorhodoplanes sp.]
MSPAEDQQLNLPNMDLPLGLRLRRAREALGLSVAEAAEKLRLKSVIIEALEKEDFDTLGAAVYVRGYFNTYAKLVGVPTVLVESVFAQRSAAPPQLRTTARISHSRYLFDRYAKRAVYVVLTASIVGPSIWLATQGQLPRQGATLRPLDAPVATQTASLPSESSDTAAAVDASASIQTFGPPDQFATRSAGETPVMAGLAPFYAPPPQSVAAAPASAAAPSVSTQGLSLHLRGDSWVEVLDAEGRRIEHGILRTGTTRDFAPGTAARVSLGNADAVEVRVNGAPTDIAAYRRANVARFTVSSDGSLAPAGG